MRYLKLQVDPWQANRLKRAKSLLSTWNRLTYMVMAYLFWRFTTHSYFCRRLNVCWLYPTGPFKLRVANTIIQLMTRSCATWVSLFDSFEGSAQLPGTLTGSSVWKTGHVTPRPALLQLTALNYHVFHWLSSKGRFRDASLAHFCLFTFQISSHPRRVFGALNQLAPF